MPKTKIIISTVSGCKKALVYGKGWVSLTRIIPGDLVRTMGKENIEWIPFRTALSSVAEEQYKLLAEGYVKDLY